MKKVVLMLAIIGLVGVAGASRASAGIHIGIHFPAPQVVIKPSPNVIIVAQPPPPPVVYQPAPVVYQPAPRMYPAPRVVQPHCAPAPVMRCNHRHHGHGGCREVIVHKPHNKHHRHYSHDHGNRRYFAGR